MTPYTCALDSVPYIVHYMSIKEEFRASQLKGSVIYSLPGIPNDSLVPLLAPAPYLVHFISSEEGFLARQEQ